MKKASTIEVWHDCEDCDVRVAFLLGRADTIVHDDGDIEYFKHVPCKDCGVVSLHAGVYQVEWEEEDVEYDL
jgi:deoxycytidylate deaminase